MKIYKMILRLVILILFSLKINAQYDSSKIFTEYIDIVKKIYKSANADSTAWEQLAFMCDTYGPRLCGSEGNLQSLEFMYQQMKKDGLENVRKEEIYVPHWVRGNEYCELLTPRKVRLHMLGIGRSINTPPEGITGEVIVVKNYDELEKRKDEVNGKIVLYNEPYKHYGQAVKYRWSGAVRAAQYGAIASLCRSASPTGMQAPHTGSMMEYPDTVAKIPHAALSHEDADMIRRIIYRGQKVIVKLYMEAKTLPDAKSYNVIGELKGNEKPDEIIALGGHSDCWDVGSGAHDDASGCFATWKALKVLKDLGLHPKRTIRAVMWTNEENGLRGGIEYAEKHKDENHVLMFEFDSGAFPPGELGVNGSDSVIAKAKSIEKVLREIGNIRVKKGAWGIDAQQLAKINNIPLMHINTDDKGKYFWYHHAATDTPDKIDPKDMNDCIAVIAAMIYIYADLP
ncbi:M20/M25/M40 family metallo-hydrolase [Bacteroidota bacterium]